MFYPKPSPQPILPTAIRGRSVVHERRALAGTEAHAGFAIWLLAVLEPNVPILWVSGSPLVSSGYIDRGTQSKSLGDVNKTRAQFHLLVFRPCARMIYPILIYSRDTQTAGHYIE